MNDGDSQSRPESPLLRVELAQQSGRRAKEGFLLAMVRDPSASPAVHAAARHGLRRDAAGLGELLVRDPDGQTDPAALSSLGIRDSQLPSVRLVAPDPGAIDPALIEGVNVPNAVIDSQAVPHLTIATLEPTDGTVGIISEYSADDGIVGALVVRNANGAEIERGDLVAGHHRFCELTIDGARIEHGTTVAFELSNDPAAELRWYQTTVVERPASPAPAVPVERVLDPPAGQPPLFVPPTGEPLGLEDVDRMLALRNKFAGERVFVMGNGPSLNKTPLELLENDFVFAVNRISLLFERISWRPTFFTAFDVRVVPDNRDEFAGLDVPYKFFSARYKKLFGEAENHYWYHTKGFYEGFAPAFEPTAIYSGFGGGGTISVMAIELAYFLGFREIYLIGTDVSYTVPETAKQSGPDVFGDGVKLELESTKDDDSNHFDPRYFGAGKKWHNPNVREMKIGFGRAAAYLEERGALLRNATVGGELNQVERVDFESLF